MNISTPEKPDRLPAISATAGKWSMRLISGIMDQGLFSGSNFMINILLARWLTPDGYGAFAIAFSIYLAFSGVVSALTLEPMMIYGATDFKDNIDDYLSKVSFIHFAVSSLLAGVLFIASLFWDGDISKTITAAAIALPFMQQVWFIRRAFYCTANVFHAAIVSLLYSIALLGGILTLKATGSISPAHIYTIFIVASLVCFAYYSIVTRILTQNKGRPCAISKIAGKHWNFGKWLIAASIAASISTLLYAPILGLMSSLKDAAAYKAIQNLTMPFMQVLTAFTLLTLPMTSRVARNESWTKARNYILTMTAVFSASACLYGAAMLIFGKKILFLLYSNNFYVEYFWLIPAFIFVMVIKSINQSMAIAVRAFECTRIILVTKICSATAVFIVLATCVKIISIKVVLLAMCLGVLTELCILLSFFIQMNRKKHFKTVQLSKDELHAV
jgi:O-antigen/teichoic acid export membrane protein